MKQNIDPDNQMQSADLQKPLIRSLVENVYDMQAVRIAMGNRLVANLRSMGLVSDAPEDEADADKQVNSILTAVLGEYKNVTTIYAEKYNSRGSIKKALSDVGASSVYIKTDLTYGIVDAFTQMSKAEQQLVDTLSKEVKGHPLWDAFFADVKGCGPMMAAVCIAYLDPYKARWPSSFWRYCGLDVVADENGMHGRCRADAYMVKYTDKHGNETERRSLGYNPTVKTKLVGVLGSAFLRAGKDAKYAKIYYDYKNRLMNRPDCQDLRPVIVHRRATRYAVKMFLKDLWYAWRTLEGLPTGEDYAVAKLGMAPHHDPRLDVEYEQELAQDAIREAAAGL